MISVQIERAQIDTPASGPEIVTLFLAKDSPGADVVPDFVTELPRGSARDYVRALGLTEFTGIQPREVWRVVRGRRKILTFNLPARFVLKGDEWVEHPVKTEGG